MTRRLRWMTASLALAIALAAAYINAYGHGSYIYALHMDGVFQTSSMMYRLAAGEMPGRNFFPYLGLGPMYMVYPVFALMGSTVSSAIASAYMMVLVVYAGAAALVTALVWRIRSYWLLAMIYFAIFVLLCAIPMSMADLGPGNSLRPLRAAVPYLCLGLILLLRRHVATAWKRVLLCGAICGMALIWSNDFGIPTFVVMMGLCIIELCHTSEMSAKTLMLLLGGAVAGSTVLLTLSTAGHPVSLLLYNFRDVAGDQYWYFGNDGRVWKIIEPRDLKIIAWDILMFLFVSVIALLAFNSRYMRLVSLGWATFLGGALAVIAGHYSTGYMDAFELWIGLVLLQILAKGVPGLRERLLTRLSPARAIATYFIAMLLLLVITIRNTHQEVDSAKAHGFYVKELGGYLDEDQRGLVEFARCVKEPLLEEYWGLASAIRHEHGPWPVDSAIAALGQQRRLAAQSLHNWNGLVSTTRVGGLFQFGLAHMYQSWAVNENWWMYGYVLKNFEPVFVSPNLIFWKRSAVPQVWPEVACHVTNSPEARVDIPAEDGFYEMTLHYAMHSRRWHANIMAETNTVILGNDSYGFISMDLKATEMTLPVYISKDMPSGLLFQIYPSTVRKDFVLQSCTARHITNYPKHLFSIVDAEGMRMAGGRYVPPKNSDSDDSDPL